MKRILTVIAMLPLASPAQQGASDAFVRQQAYAEMKRVASQIDVLQANFDNLQRRVARLEARGDQSGLRVEVESLRATVEELRRQLAAQRGEIVNDLSKRLSSMQHAPAAPKSPPPPPKKVVIGPHLEYTVKPGDTLSLISQAFDCPVKKIKEMNGLKSDNLRVGQKIMLPK